jgi:hypothetical protein
MTPIVSSLYALRYITIHIITKQIGSSILPSFENIFPILSKNLYFAKHNPTRTHGSQRKYSIVRATDIITGRFIPGTFPRQKFIMAGMSKNKGIVMYGLLLINL